MTPCRGTYYSLPFLPATPSSLSRTRLASCVAFGTKEIQGHRQVWRARRRGPRTLSRNQEQLTQTLIVRLLKTHLFLLFHKLAGPSPPLNFQFVIGKICWEPVMATISPSAAALSTGEGVVVGVHDVSVDPDGGVREKLLYHMRSGH